MRTKENTRLQGLSDAIEIALRVKRVSDSDQAIVAAEVIASFLRDEIFAEVQNTIVDFGIETREELK